MGTAPVAEGVACGPAAANAVAPNAATTMRATCGREDRVGFTLGLLLLDADVAELDARAMAKETDVAPGVGDPA